MTKNDFTSKELYDQIVELEYELDQTEKECSRLKTSIDSLTTNVNLAKLIEDLYVLKTYLKSDSFEKELDFFFRATIDKRL